MNILVTGGAGYIGSHTCVELLSKGHEVIIVDNYCNSSENTIKLIEEISGKPVMAYKCDILDESGLERVFSAHTIDAVIHFAGLKAVGESVSMPLNYYNNNISGTVVLLRVMEKFGVQKLVFSSSATVYGMNNPVPFKEDMPTSATNPYGRTKLMIEEILKDLTKANPEFKVAILRYFNPIGAHKSGKIGENPNGIPNNLMPYIMDVAKGKLPQLNVFGNDYPTKDGTGVRDYIHVCDLAIGHILALDKLDSLNDVGIYNLGSGQGISVLELLAGAEKACGKAIPYQVAPRRPGDIAECYADVSKSERELSFKTTLGVEDMCADAWRFVQNAR